jgi:hypothetical protein
VAPAANIDDDAVDDSRGLYSEGAYVAATPIGPVLPSSLETAADDAELDISPQAAYTKRLLSIFLQKRREIKSVDAASAFETLPPGTRIRFPDNPEQWIAAFDRLISTKEPAPVYMAVLRDSVVSKLLGAAALHLQRGRNIGPRFSAWTWGLLCRVGDSGLLDNDAISAVRELGKKAVWVGIGFLNEEMAQITAGFEGADTAQHPSIEADTSMHEGLDEPVEPVVKKEARGRRRATNGTGRRRNTSSPMPPDRDIISAGNPHEAAKVGSEAESEAVEAKKQQLLARLDSDTESGAILQDLIQESAEAKECPDVNTRATIDMIITIAGELYGQRDLLEFRDCWGGEMGLWG